MINKYKIKTKIINNLIRNGSKEKSEQILHKTIKNIQKTSKKESKNLILTSIGLTTPTFKIHSIKQKKRKKKRVKIIPSFISNKNRRLSLAIKLIIKSIRKKYNAHYELKKELFNTVKNSSNSLDKKKDMQRQALINKTMLKFYRWH